MIRSIRLKNLALVSDLLWELGARFNILTGETGAGKSILIDGLNLLLGERADKTLIRSGEQTCTVESEMELPSRLVKIINTTLDEIGAEACDGSTLLLKRSFSLSGTNKQFANGSPITLQGLKKIGDLLVDVHGPHDHQSLLQNEKQISILDAYGKLDPLLGDYRKKFEALQQLRETMQSLQMNERDKMQKLEILTYQHREIEAAKLQAGEDLTVEQNYKIAANSRQLLEFAATISTLLSESENSALSQLAAVEKALSSWQKLDARMEESVNLNRSAIVQLKELLATVQESAERMDLDDKQMHALEERLNLLHKLKKKYGPTLEEVILLGEKIGNEIATLESSDEKLAELKKEEPLAEKATRAAAEKLSKARRETAEPLGKKIQQQLRELGFAKALFQIDCAPLTDFSRSGMDAVEFIFAPNPGEEPRPLKAIASSGEMARVMLAIKTTLAEVDEVPILIFDEIDANVGGETATQVGKKLRSLGKSHQVICITHLPQVAAQGETHYAVSKAVKAGRSITELRELESKERMVELARMLGGDTPKSRELAKSLLQGG